VVITDKPYKTHIQRSYENVEHTNSVANRSASMKSLPDTSTLASCSARACKLRERNYA